MCPRMSGRCYRRRQEQQHGHGIGGDASCPHHPSCAVPSTTPRDGLPSGMTMTPAPRASVAALFIYINPPRNNLYAGQSFLDFSGDRRLRVCEVMIVALQKGNDGEDTTGHLLCTCCWPFLCGLCGLRRLLQPQRNTSANFFLCWRRREINAAAAPCACRHHCRHAVLAQHCTTQTNGVPKRSSVAK